MPFDKKTLSLSLIVIIALSCQFLNVLGHVHKLNVPVHTELTGTLS